VSNTTEPDAQKQCRSKTRVLLYQFNESQV